MSTANTLGRTMSRASLLVVVACVVIGVTSTAAQSPRAFLPEDLLRIEELGDAVLSPDGQHLAYVVKRSKREVLSQNHTFDQFRLAGNDRGDVWLAQVSGGAPHNLTKGTDGSGYWLPTWSPDGRKLAMLSNRDGNVRAWLWDHRTGGLRQLHDRAVDIQFGENPFVWLDSQRLTFAVLPEGERPIQMDLDFRAARRAMAVWERYLPGTDATVSVIETGIPPRLDGRSDGSLLVVDIERGVQTIAVAPGFRSLALSPDKRSLAFLKQVGTLQPKPDELLPHGRPQLFAIYQATVVSVDGEAAPRTLPPRDVFPGSLRWSSNSGELALIGSGADLAGGSPEFHRCQMASAACRAIPDLEAVLPSGQWTPALWSAANDLVVFARTRIRRAPTASNANRRDWWAVSAAGGKPENLTAAMAAPPGRLFPDTQAGFVGLSQGQLWRIRTNAIHPEMFQLNMPAEIDSIAWPRVDPSSVSASNQLILAVKRESGTELLGLEIASGRTTAIKSPTPEPVVADHDAERRVSVLTARNRTGTYLWLSSPGAQRVAPVVERNTFLRDVAEASTRKIQYRSLDGRELQAWLLLPFGYQEGTRYPMITSVYAGSMAGSQPPAAINSTGTLNLQLLAGHGFAVLIPSMPLDPMGEASDPYLDLTKGVLPAIDKVIELGIAEPKRLGLIGHSYGGYSTYGLITLTSRFQAAVALAGISDIVSFYGQFDPRFRYEAAPHHIPFQMSQVETGQLRMGNPPWRDFDRYIRNSPLSYVHRVTTPLMIIQGDQDFVPMSQGELFFSALHRQQKRAAMVRYWGEGHVPESPANILDMWKRIFNWFDEFLRTSPKK